MIAPPGRRPACDDAGGLGIYPNGQLPFVLCALDCRVGSRIHNQIGSTTIKDRRNFFRLCQIEQGTVCADNSSGVVESYAESPSYLPCHTGDQDAHPSGP